MNKIIAIIACLLTIATAWADDYLIFEPYDSYRIESLSFPNTSIAPGASHRISTPVCIEKNAVMYKSADCYWNFIHKSDGKYLIRNASSNKYIVWSDEYVNLPSRKRYLDLADKDEGEIALWYIKVAKANDGNEYLYIQSVYQPTYFFNVRTDNSYVVGTYDKKSAAAVPGGDNELFRFYDSNGELYKPHSGTIEPKPEPPVDLDSIAPEQRPAIDSTKALKPYAGDVLHIYRADGKLDAIPMVYVADRTTTKDSIKVTAINGAVYAYANYEVDSISTNVPTNFPRFNSFKFNNKFNHHIIEDAAGTFFGDTLITASVVGIGKTLRPSFKLDDDAQAWIDDQPQDSKISNPRFAFPVEYTIARHGSTILRQTLSGDYVVRPYGRQTRVEVDFATDHSTAKYKVPTVYLTTDNGTMITSKSYYKSGTITIDGGGVFPDMETTPVQIKGRGNSSWPSGGNGKAPYHIKFEEGQKPFGLTKGKNWNLIANAQKQSMTTNAIAMKMAQLVETAAFNHEIPIDLYINGQYRGSYNFTENIRFANNSIDLENETYAALLELDSYYDEENYKFRDKNYNLPVNVKAPDFKEGTSLLTTAVVEQAFNRVTTDLVNGRDMSYSLDLDYLARFFFVDEFTANFELNHPKSTYLYNPNLMDSDGRFIFGPCWDFDWAYGYAGSAGYFNNHSTIDYWERTSGDGHPWARAQRYCGDNFDQIYYNVWYDFVNRGKLQELLDFCGDYYRYAAHSFSHDNSIWNKGDAATYAAVTEKSIKWLNERAHYVFDYMTNTLGYGSKGYIRTPSHLAVGDVNGDGRITTADVVCVLNYMLQLPNEDFSFRRADADHNEMITISDLLSVRNLIGSSVRSSGFYGLPQAQAVVSTGTATATPTGVNIPLTISVDDADYCGLQFDLKIPAGMTIEDLDISASIPDHDIYIAELDADDYIDQSVDRYRVSIYSSAAHKLPKGDSRLQLQLGWGSATNRESVLAATLAEVQFVSTLGEDERSSSQSALFTAAELTGLSDAVAAIQQDQNMLTVTASQETALPVYTLDGRTFRIYSIQPGTQTLTLPSGIYIVNKQKVAIP